MYKFDVVCLDRATGKILWQKTAREEVPHEGHHPEHGFASYSPVTDGTHVWASFGSRGVHCYDLDGRHKWSRDLGRMKAKMMFGEGSSPALAGDALIVVMDQEDESFIYALNKNTGEILWKQPRDEDTVLGHAGGRGGERQAAGDRQRDEAHSQLRRRHGRADLAVRRPDAERHSLSHRRPTAWSSAPAAFAAASCRPSSSATRAT